MYKPGGTARTALDKSRGNIEKDYDNVTSPEI